MRKKLLERWDKEVMSLPQECYADLIMKSAPQVLI
jgi:hypothetical protein